MRILVVGAGIAGLAAARALTRAGQAVEVVERAAGPDRGGAGLYLPGNAVRALRRVGLDELAAEPIRAQRILDHRGRLLTDVDLPSFWGPAGPCVGMLRADLHRALAAGVRVGYGLEPVPPAAADRLGPRSGAPPGPDPRATRADPGRGPAAGRRAALPRRLPPAARRAVAAASRSRR